MVSEVIVNTALPIVKVPSVIFPNLNSPESVNLELEETLYCEVPPKMVLEPSETRLKIVTRLEESVEVPAISSTPSAAESLILPSEVTEAVTEPLEAEEILEKRFWRVSVEETLICFISPLIPREKVPSVIPRVSSLVEESA